MGKGLLDHRPLQTHTVGSLFLCSSLSFSCPHPTKLEQLCLSIKDVLPGYWLFLHREESIYGL